MYLIPVRMIFVIVRRFHAVDVVVFQFPYVSTASWLLAHTPEYIFKQQIYAPTQQPRDQRSRNNFPPTALRCAVFDFILNRTGVGAMEVKKKKVSGNFFRPFRVPIDV